MVGRGQVACDERAFHKEQDGRRGMTLIARLAPGALQRIGIFLETARAIEPQQYYYPLADIHLTVLSLFTATEQYQPYLERVGEYLEAVDEAVAGAPAFTLDTAGLTLTTSAVLTQGFPLDTTLEDLRSRLRAALKARGLGSGLDQRSRLRTAHNTVIRFTVPLQGPEKFAAALQEARSYPFGRSTLTALDLVFNDWYMTSERLNVLKTYII